MSGSSSTRPAEADGRPIPRRSSLATEQADSRRRCKLSSHHPHPHHPSSAGFSQKHRQKDSKRCSRRRELSRQQHDHELLSRGQQQQTGAPVGRERVTSLFNDIGALDCLSSVAWRDSQFMSESSDLENRFWADGQADGRPKAGCASAIVAEPRRIIPPATETERSADFSALPFDVLRRIAGSFSWPNLWATSKVCKGWSDALEPLREAMLFVHWGKKLKHGRGGCSRNLTKALDSFLKGAVRGCAAAMVDAGLLLWEMVSFLLISEPFSIKTEAVKNCVSGGFFNSEEGFNNSRIFQIFFFGCIDRFRSSSLAHRISLQFAFADLVLLCLGMSETTQLFKGTSWSLSFILRP